MSLADWLESHWQERSAVSFLLFPVSLAYCGTVRVRRAWIEFRQRNQRRPPVAAIVVVGNITVGGTGKTPLVVWLCRYLREQGFWPGVVSRGYGGRPVDQPREVTARSDPREVGDEPVLIAQRTGSPVFVDPDRRRAAEALLMRYRCDVIVSDDGLQHYRLPRDIEIAVVDGDRRFGNGLCLPAGPLREPLSRLHEVDFIVTNGRPQAGEHPMKLTVQRAMNLADPSKTRALKSFRAERGVHAVAGIGNPQRFFDLFAAEDIRFEAHAFPDHHPFTEADLDFGDSRPVLMTEKDAVKCRGFAKPHHWFLPVAAVPATAFAHALIESVQALKQMYNLR